MLLMLWQLDMTKSLISRLTLKPEKISSLAKYVCVLADMEEPIGQILKRTELADELVLEKISCPLGAILIIFESRPDALVQIAALAIRSRNGLLLKGGKEARRSNAALHKVVISAIPDTVRAVVRDAKTDYPAACNAMETLLVHKNLSCNGGLNELILQLQREDVQMYGGPKASAVLNIAEASSLHHEYSSLTCTIEIVEDVFAAIDHINKHGSAHTECIVTEDSKMAETFLSQVDSAAAFHNASTRFCDGARSGLGPEDIEGEWTGSRW